MYSWVTHTWNPIRGRCPHDCSYCYMKQFPVGRLRFDKDELQTDLGAGKTIFVGSSCDMFAGPVVTDWIDAVLKKCREFNRNRYLFQSKNPQRMGEFIMSIPEKSILGTTLESNRIYEISKAPSISERVKWLKAISDSIAFDFIISIEPILDFDLEPFVKMIRSIEPCFVSVGADSKNNKLPEPTSKKIRQLITALREFTNVKIKNNLQRLLREIYEANS